MSTSYRFRRLARRKTGWPIATVAFYGPDASTASKMVVGIVPSEGVDPDVLRKWYSEDGRDLREDETVLEEAMAFIAEHEAKRVAMADRLFGCPHEEGIDYEGEVCPDPDCVFWRHRDRFTHGPKGMPAKTRGRRWTH